MESRAQFSVKSEFGEPESEHEPSASEADRRFSTRTALQGLRGEGLVAEGLIAEGLIAEGLIAEGLATVAEGLVATDAGQAGRTDRSGTTTDRSKVHFYY